jgi:predicted nucleic acid-binding protein
VTAILVDSNVLLDITTEDSYWLTWSAAVIEQAANSFRLVINPVIYAEVRFAIRELSPAMPTLPKAMFDREATSVKPPSSPASALWPIGGGEG